jgi:hypothetical protein
VTVKPGFGILDCRIIYFGKILANPFKIDCTFSNIPDAQLFDLAIINLSLETKRKFIDIQLSPFHLRFIDG